MKILLINPHRFIDGKGNIYPVIREDRCENIDSDCIHPPTSLIYLAGVLQEEGHEVGLLDANGLNYSSQDIKAYLKFYKPEWVIFRSAPSTFYSDTDVARYCRELGIKNMMLNWNLHDVPHKVLKECPEIDFYINQYHYEYAIPDFITEYDNLKNIKYGENIPYFKTFDIPEPPWYLVDDFKRFYTRTPEFSPWAVVRGSKGCSFQCSFCIDQGQEWCSRSPELIGDELEYLVRKRKVKRISFFDNSFEVGGTWCLDIANEIEKRKLKFKWYINSRSDLICREGVDFFKRLRSVGLDGSSIGVEFGSQEMLNKSSKGTTIKDNYDCIKILHEAGVKSYCSLMMGYLGETKDQILETERFIREAKPTGFQINPVTVYEGTRLWQQCIIEERIPSDLDWRGISCVPTDISQLKLSELSVEELYNLRKKIYERLYFGEWMFRNALNVLVHPSDWRLGFGYFLSMIKRKRNGVIYSH